MKSTEEKQANEPVCQNGTANFGPTGPSDQSGPASEVVPNIPIGWNRNGPFHMTSDRNYRNFWHNGRHSWRNDEMALQAGLNMEYGCL